MTPDEIIADTKKMLKELKKLLQERKCPYIIVFEITDDDSYPNYSFLEKFCFTKTSARVSRYYNYGCASIPIKLKKE